MPRSGRARAGQPPRPSRPRRGIPSQRCPGAPALPTRPANSSGQSPAESSAGGPRPRRRYQSKSTFPKSIGHADLNVEIVTEWSRCLAPDNRLICPDHEVVARFPRWGNGAGRPAGTQSASPPASKVLPSMMFEWTRSGFGPYSWPVQSVNRGATSSCRWRQRRVPGRSPAECDALAEESRPGLVTQCDNYSRGHRLVGPVMQKADGTVTIVASEVPDFRGVPWTEYSNIRTVAVNDALRRIGVGAELRSGQEFSSSI